LAQRTGRKPAGSIAAAWAAARISVSALDSSTIGPGMDDLPSLAAVQRSSIRRTRQRTSAPAQVVTKSPTMP
jgi:hypothetical protein